MHVIARPDAVDRSLARLRLLVGVVVIVVSVSGFQRGDRPVVACAGIAAGLLIPLSTYAERAGRKLIGTPRSSAILVAVDTAVVLGALILADVGWGATTSFVLVLPVLQAGIRHGVLGAAVTWGGITAVVALTTALEWDGTSSGLGRSVEYTALLLLVALPLAHLSEHLAERVEFFARARAEADRRADVLASVLTASGALVSPDPEHVDTALVAAVTELTGGRVDIVDEPATDLPAEPAPEPPPGEHGATLCIELGGDVHRVLRATTDRPLDRFTGDAVELLCAHADIARHAASMHAAARNDAAAWEHQARIDPLTGLLNRGGVLKHLDAVLGTRTERVVVAFIDLDGFKEINDIHGHEAGDQLLLDLAACLRTSEPGNVAGRLGGDEFVVVSQLSPGDTGAAFRERLSMHLEFCMHPGSPVGVEVGASVGYAVAEPDHDASASDLLRAADASMYEAKRAQRRHGGGPPWPPPLVGEQRTLVAQ